MHARYMFALAATAALAQPLPKAAFEQQPATLLSNGALELTVLDQGATMADLVFTAGPEKLSPLWNPSRMSRELGAASPRWNTHTGHFVCVDGFGGGSREERAAGLPGHGEAHSQIFERTRSAREGKTAVLTMTAALPIVQEKFTRTFRMVDGEKVVYVESKLESLLGFDRAVNWAEHATIGSPFLEAGATFVDVAGVRSQTRPYPQPNTRPNERLLAARDFTWPAAPAMNGGTIDMRATPAGPVSDHAATLIDPSRPLGWVTAIHVGKRLVFGYVFKREEYPWVQHWGNYPANGKFARGMEFGTQPYDVPRREVISAGSMFEAPLFRWLPAKSAIETRFLMFYTEVPEGFRKVDAVRLENGKLTIEDKSSGKQVVLLASLPL